jgi:hypothetical protein
MIEEALIAITSLKGIPERCFLEDDNNRKVHFDSVENESWSSSTSVTDYSVEKGKNITDHIKVNPDSISLSSTISNHTSITQQILDAKSLDVTDSLTERLNQLIEWQKKGALLTYYGALWEGVTNCLITSMGQNRTSSTGEAVELTLSLQKVEIAEQQETSPASPESTQDTYRKGQAKTQPESIELNSNSGYF